jgi:hypothetical protein
MEPRAHSSLEPADDDPSLRPPAAEQAAMRSGEETAPESIIEVLEEAAARRWGADRAGVIAGEIDRLGRAIWVILAAEAPSLDEVPDDGDLPESHRTWS